MREIRDLDVIRSPRAWAEPDDDFEEEYAEPTRALAPMRQRAPARYERYAAPVQYAPAPQYPREIVQTSFRKFCKKQNFPLDSLHDPYIRDVVLMKYRDWVIAGGDGLTDFDRGAWEVCSGALTPLRWLLFSPRAKAALEIEDQ